MDNELHKHRCHVCGCVFTEHTEGKELEHTCHCGNVNTLKYRGPLGLTVNCGDAALTEEETFRMEMDLMMSEVADFLMSALR